MVMTLTRIHIPKARAALPGTIGIAFHYVVEIGPSARDNSTNICSLR